MVVNKRIALIGAGNVATHLGQAFQQVGCKIVQVYSRTMASAAVLGKLLSVPYTVSLEEVCGDADVYVVALKDSALENLLPFIIKGREDALFVHTAGSMPMDVWKGYVPHYGVFYPMQTFSKERKVDFQEVSFFLEASGPEELGVLKEMASVLSPKVYEATSEQRKYLHIAAVFACNFANHMYALSARLLEQNGLPFEAMLPLIDETARKVHELSPVKAQTGPAVRSDENVMNSHLTLLEDDSRVRDLYKRISESIHQLKKV